jgi:hypothetical protein
MTLSFRSIPEADVESGEVGHTNPLRDRVRFEQPHVAGSRPKRKIAAPALTTVF